VSAIDKEVRRICEEIREAELNDMTAEFVAMGLPREFAEEMAETLMREIESLVVNIGWVVH
jgi:hypothetical protein